jgi:Holliday junction resolvase RusA-like endonuclease
LPRFDVDNCAKAALDALNGVAFEDDSQVAKLVVEKSYGQEARTTVRIA